MEKEWKVGDIVSKDLYTSCAVFCNKNGTLHIEEQDGKYVIVANDPIPEPTIEDQVHTLEAQTGLTRAMRELVLAENSGASDYIKQKAQEIENKAQVLRVSDDMNEIREAINAETLLKLSRK